MKKNYFWILKYSFVFIIFLYGCSMRKPIEENKQFYLDFIKQNFEYKGTLETNGKSYTNPLIYRTWGAKTCVYGETPNSVISDTIIDFFELIKNELGNELYFSHPVLFSTHFNDCPDNTDIFVYIFNKNTELNSTIKQRDRIIDRYNFPQIYKEKIYHPQVFGAFSVYSNDDTLKTLISINQGYSLKELNLNQKELLKIVIVEELYQGFTLGYNQYTDKPLFSKSQEPKIKFTKQYESVFNKLTQSERINMEIDLYPSGLCTFDLWHLLTKYKYGRHIKYFEGYKKLFTKNFIDISHQSEEIARNPKYKDIIDQRCSLNNAGKFSKIPVWGS